MYIYIYIYFFFLFREERRGFFFFSSPRSKIGNPNPIRTSPFIPTKRAPPATFPGNVPTPAMLPCRRQCHPPRCRRQRRKKSHTNRVSLFEPEPTPRRLPNTPWPEGLDRKEGRRNIPCSGGQKQLRRPLFLPINHHGNLWEKIPQIPWFTSKFLL